ncbi:unnamed protein product [Caenorhabditis nigoni]
MSPREELNWVHPDYRDDVLKLSNRGAECSLINIPISTSGGRKDVHEHFYTYDGRRIHRSLEVHGSKRSTKYLEVRLVKNGDGGCLREIYENRYTCIGRVPKQPQPVKDSVLENNLKTSKT